MKFEVKIFHWIIFLWLLLVIIRFDLVINYLSLFVEYIAILISDSASARIIVSFRLADAFLSALILILFVPLLLVFRKRLKFLNNKLNFSFAFLILLGFVFLFTPVISNENPEFSGNLSVTKLLPPLSRVIQIEKQDLEPLTEAEKFLIRAESIIKPSFSNKVIFVDSIYQADKVIYFQNSRSYEIEMETLVRLNGKILMKEKIFPLGTDDFGRDIFTRLLYGTRISISVGLGAVLLSFIIGITFGFIAGYKGGILDILLNRFAEIFLAFPVIYLIILILALFGSSVISVIIVLGISGWMSLFKIVKSEVLSIKQRDYFSTAELIGLSKIQLLFKEIFPLTFIPVLVNLVFLFSNVVLAEAALSYLGLGTGNEYPSWGAMINSGQEYITKAWWMITFPGSILVLTLFAFNSSGKKLGKLFNPRMK